MKTLPPGGDSRRKENTFRVGTAGGTFALIFEQGPCVLTSHRAHRLRSQLVQRKMRVRREKVPERETCTEDREKA